MQSSFMSLCVNINILRMNIHWVSCVSNSLSIVKSVNILNDGSWYAFILIIFIIK